jgi:hypothetical protein
MTASIQPLIPTHEPMSPAHRDVDAILTLLSKRHSCREFDSSQIDVAEIGSIIEDGIQAPSSCNHQNWHFIAISRSVRAPYPAAIITSSSAPC